MSQGQVNPSISITTSSKVVTIGWEVGFIERPAGQ